MESRGSFVLSNRLSGPLMSGSIQNLYTQSRSLQAYSQALQVTGQNIASSADPNYTRQQVTMQSALPASLGNLHGSGVNAVLKDTRDQLLEGQIWREQSNLNYQKGTLNYSERLELSFFGGSEAPLEVAAGGGEYVSSGLLTAINGFYDAWADLEAQPNDTAARQAVYDRAEALIDRFRNDAETLGEMRITAEKNLEDTTRTVNGLLGRVAGLQEQIARMPANPSSAKSELTAMRDQTLSALSEHISFTWSPSATTPLESTLSVRLEDGSTATLVTGGTVNDTLAYSDGTVSLTGGGGVLAAGGGAIGAHQHFLNSELPQWENQWNLLAGEVVRVTNTVYNPGATEGENFFDPGFATAGSMRLEISRAADIRAGVGGVGNDVARAIAEIGNADLDGEFGSPLSGSFADVLLDRQNTLARRINSLQGNVGAQEKVVNFLEQEKAGRSGVDLDREITMLLQFQRSFQATSRVLRALDESLQTFLSDI